MGRQLWVVGYRLAVAGLPAEGRLYVVSYQFLCFDDCPVRPGIYSCHSEEAATSGF